LNLIEYRSSLLSSPYGVRVFVIVTISVRTRRFGFFFFFEDGPEQGKRVQLDQIPSKLRRTTSI